MEIKSSVLTAIQEAFSENTKTKEGFSKEKLVSLTLTELGLTDVCEEDERGNLKVLSDDCIKTKFKHSIAILDDLNNRSMHPDREDKTLWRKKIEEEANQRISQLKSRVDEFCSLIEDFEENLSPLSTHECYNPMINAVIEVHAKQVKSYQDRIEYYEDHKTMSDKDLLRYIESKLEYEIEDLIDSSPLCNFSNLEEALETAKKAREISNLILKNQEDN